MKTIAPKKFAELTAEEKAKRYAYAKTRRKKIEDAARAAGVIGLPRVKMSPAEAKAKRKEYAKEYRKRVQAEARAYRQLIKDQELAGGKPARRGR